MQFKPYELGLFSDSDWASMQSVTQVNIMWIDLSLRLLRLWPLQSTNIGFFVEQQKSLQAQAYFQKVSRSSSSSTSW